MILNGYYSDYSEIGCGVPPGSALGPLIFHIYDDLERNIKSNIKFLAEDTILFFYSK